MREGACTGASTMPQPSALSLILNAAALAWVCVYYCSTEPGTSQVCVYYCSTLLLFITAVPNTKLCAWGEEDRGEHVLWDTTSRGLCGLAIITH